MPRFYFSLASKDAHSHLSVLLLLLAFLHIESRVILSDIKRYASSAT
jgi:hypothetical protein